MRKFFVQTVLTVLVAGLFSACSSVTDQPSTSISFTFSAEAEAILAQVNTVRQRGADCGSEGRFGPAAPLKLEGRLSDAAQKHSEDRAETQVPGHTTPQGAIHYLAGTTFDERIVVEGYRFSLAGENVAFNYGSAEAVMAAWLSSDGHCANIMNPKFQDLGVGHAERYWTQKFAAPL